MFTYNSLTKTLELPQAADKGLQKYFQLLSK